ncbi:MAG: DUF3147 family protein [Pseudomonadota bacterium]|jgi:uncharacterized membrane protein (GlpM family)|nr:hypothetical protein [Gammaproteobacteria bacterium]MEC7918113.1 DUF3147 family protein [Pseudomonadota bacterium]|tara:strand:+ start:387 stop:731 length:345 start_codon:yes stop_codon:yes gene_type:complete
MYLIIKTIVTALVIVAISEIARRSSLFAGILASIPLTSVLAMTWLYFDTRNVKSVIELSNSVLLLIPPSIIFFLTFPFLLKKIDFLISLAISILLTALTYWIYISLLTKFGVKL